MALDHYNTKLPFPAKWRSAVFRAWIRYRLWLWIALYLALMVIWPLCQPPAPLDISL